MRSAVGKWIGPIVVVEVDPAYFDDGNFPQLLARLEQHFMMKVSVITPDWEADHGIRVKGEYCPIEILSDPALVWRDLTLPEDPDTLPF